IPSAPIVTCARILPLLAAVTPRSRYLKKERRPATRGAVVGVAYASLPGGLTAAACPVDLLASFIMGILLRVGMADTTSFTRNRLFSLPERFMPDYRRPAQTARRRPRTI